MKILKINLLIATLVCISIINDAQTIKPVKNSNGTYGFTFANVYFEVNPSKGGRVTSLKIDSTQILNLVNINGANGSDNAGSVFWPSPQSVWNWPPPLELNYNAFSAYPTDSNVMVIGSKNSTLSLSETKVYTVNPADTSITITYYLKNWKSTAQQWAPWEITRVNASGLTFFAVNSKKDSGTMASNIKIISNNGWYNEDSSKVTAAMGTAKVFCDGNGWLAHLTKDRYLFIKKFPHIKASLTAKGETEVECYTSSDNVYTELEDQGAYTSIASGDSLKWQTKWYVRKLPAGIKGVSGEPALLKFANVTMKTDTVAGTNINRTNVSSIQVFPNPVADILTISSVAGKAFAAVYSLQGQLLLKQSITGTTQLNMSNLVSGVYLLEITGNENEKILSKVIVKR